MYAITSPIAARTYISDRKYGADIYVTAAKRESTLFLVIFFNRANIEIPDKAIDNIIVNLSASNNDVKIEKMAFIYVSNGG